MGAKLGITLSQYRNTVNITTNKMTGMRMNDYGCMLTRVPSVRHAKECTESLKSYA